MTEILPFEYGMTLGRTYDLRSHTIGMDIFPTEYTASPHTVKHPLTEIKYHVIKNSSDVNNVFNISGDISLKVKAGILKFHGMGSYLKDNRSKENTLEILAVARVKTETTTLMNPPPVTNGNKNNTGTHYIRSIIYGGDLVISILITASDAKHLQEIKGKVESGLHVQGFLDAKGRADLKQLEQDLKETSEIQFSYYGTIQVKRLPRDIESMLKALDEFPNRLKTTNDGKGAPISCELVSLAYLDPNFPAVLRQTCLQAQISELEEMYDEIRQAKSMLQSFFEANAEHMTKEQGENGSEIDDRIQRVMSRFNKFIATLDVTTTGDSLDQIQHAVDYYSKNKKIGGFRTEVKIFIKGTQRSTPVKDLPLGQPLSILLVGMSGHGKSATANSIFGEEKFCTHMGSESVSKHCQMENGTIGGREICLVDTPGSIYINDHDTALQVLETAIAFCPRGFHAILFVFSIDVRIRLGDKMAIEMLKMMFGPDILVKYGVFIFTHGDSFMRNMKKHKRKTTFLEHIKSQGGVIANGVKECKNRCALIDNLEEDPGILRDQVISIIKLIDMLVNNNNGITYNKFEEEEKRSDVEKVELERKKTRRNKSYKEAHIQAVQRIYQDQCIINIIMRQSTFVETGKLTTVLITEKHGSLLPDALA